MLYHRYKLLFFCILQFLLPFRILASGENSGVSISLNGRWQMGFSRHYTQTVTVPGISTDPTHISDETLWYKKIVQLPKGDWKLATLELKGARFMPQVYINGELISQQEGGMAPTFFVLNHKSVQPGTTVELEIALASLKNVPKSDASYIPLTDQWRTNVSSGLWDDVILHLHGETGIDRIIPFTDYKSQTVNVKFDLSNAEAFRGKAILEFIKDKRSVLLMKTATIAGPHNSIDISLAGKLKSWSPESPNLYHLKLIILNSKNQISDESIIPYGVKTFRIQQKHFYLNDRPFQARGGTVVWHRWMRTAEGGALGFDTAWFKTNIIQRLKDHGANYIRFHLGKPPERLLDLCDKYGLIVQYEWSFFHGIPATKESLAIQYKSWLDVAMRHPSVCMFHPYNETNNNQVDVAWEALNQILVGYPPLVFEDRDVIHVHKYWWSFFENVGLYYDSANVFPKAIMVDEFGGNYLDENGAPGAYSAIKESFLRFLGRNSTMQDRLKLQTQSNSQMAEYWRRVGAAGLAPFCIVGSYQDGNSWFFGPIKNGDPKPVWDALTAAFAPQSVSINVWDKDYVPFQKVDVPVDIFNDDAKPAMLSFKLSIIDKHEHAVFNKIVTVKISPFRKEIRRIQVVMPGVAGEYNFQAQLLNKHPLIKYPVISQWDIRVFKAVAPGNVKRLKIAIPNNEGELREFLNVHHLAAVDLTDTAADVIMTSLKSWRKLSAGDSQLSAVLRDAIARGKSVIMLDAGDRPFGRDYPSNSGAAPLQRGVPKVTLPVVKDYALFGGISLRFKETAEPESFIHPARSNRDLWGNMPDNYTGIWNGLRGGLIAPAMDMEFFGLSPKAFINQWKSRGADETKIKEHPYYAYELQGFYEFSDQENNPEMMAKLRAKVKFLVQDAPALANAINPLTPITTTDLAKGYRDAAKGMADAFTPLGNCAKNLTQTPVAAVYFGEKKGMLLVSQLLTAGRLAKAYGETGFYGIRYDEVTAQYVLNMISLSVKRNRENIDQN
ncbi:MAG: glycoside hydrolase family 2 sugar binding protein [Mucilaginibacter sp.]|nr:glycoside hydrolase family 2 sugar binding protein [Mucilaginibacter sp.]